MQRAKPFVRWVGGKKSILPELLPFVPKRYNAYHEPFVGGGALFFALQPRDARLSDLNADLTNAYEAVRDHCEDLLRLVERHARLHSRAYYYHVRDMDCLSPVARAARFIYLNKTCYGGLYRVNRAGEFNAAAAKHHPPIVDAANLRAASAALAGVDIQHRCFTAIEPRAGDLVYCDPPHIGTFASYTAGGFGEDRHAHLAHAARKWSRDGAHVVVSNADTPLTRKLYGGHHWTIHPVSARNAIRPKAPRRRELIIASRAISRQRRRATAPRECTTFPTGDCDD